jgi:methionyl-tRNA formyltransferase
LRTVFLGTSQFAAAVLERLDGGPHRPVLVVTRPDRPQGRGRRVSPPAVAAKAGELGLALLQPESVNDADTCERIAAARPEALVVCAFGALIKEPLLSDHEILNVHPSLLPRWRGAAPIERAIMAGDAETGVSIMRLTAGLDSGPVCRVATEPIGEADDYGSLVARLERVGGQLLVGVLDQLGRGEPLDWREQDDELSSYAAKIESDDRELDLTMSAGELARIVRALHPHIGARVALADSERLGVLVASPAPGTRPAAAGGDGAPAVLFERDGRLLVACCDGALELLEVKPAGGRAMPASEYLRGRSLSSG